MKELSRFLILFLTAFILCCDNNKRTNKRTEFLLTGQVNGFADSTWLFLNSGLENSIDSVCVINGKFKFSGSIPDSTHSVKYILKTRDYSDYKFLWIENSEITFQAIRGDFRKAKITGSDAQDDEVRLAARIQPINDEMDSVGKLLNSDSINETLKGELITRNNRNEKRKYEEIINFIKDNPHSIVSAQELSVYASTWGREPATALYNGFTEQNKKTIYGRQVEEFIRLNKDIVMGQPAYDFKQTDVQGKDLKLSDFRGKTVLLEFWASWCGPCRRENPELVKTYQIYKDKGFEILGVSLDDNKDRWLSAISHDQLPWPNLCDLKGDRNEAAIIYGIGAIPDNFLIDANGLVIARNLRGKELREKLERIF
jgi:thiol-disulfide isomerase/thioredoxin